MQYLTRNSENINSSTTAYKKLKNIQMKAQKLVFSIRQLNNQNGQVTTDASTPDY